LGIIDRSELSWTDLVTRWKKSIRHFILQSIFLKIEKVTMKV
jgi:hypothetical protein